MAPGSLPPRGTDPARDGRAVRRLALDGPEVDAETRDRNPRPGRGESSTVRRRTRGKRPGADLGDDGRNFDAETREKISAAQRDRELPEKTRERISEALDGRTLPEETRRKMSEATAGEANPNWRGGYSDRYGAGWTAAREVVRERDEVCQYCGCNGSERRLDVHHLTPFGNSGTIRNES